MTIGILLTLGAMSCFSTDKQPEPDPCDEQDCAGHGECLVLGGQAMCVCDEETYWDGFTCAPKPACAGTGQECSEDVDCCTGFCFLDWYSFGRYCSLHNCQSDAECVDLSDDSLPMCCSQDSDGSSHCHKIEEGQTCGDQESTCGSFCDGQGDSACQPDHICIWDGCHRYCARRCDPDENHGMCDGCRYENDTDPEPWFSCHGISGGDYVCLDSSERYGGCNSSSDCCDLNDSACIPWTGAGGSSLEGTCNRLGEMPIGAPCDWAEDPSDLPPEQRCVGFYCFRDHCTEVCFTDDDCPADMVCGNWTFQMNIDGSVTDQIGMCLWMAGSRDPCESDLDCPAGEVCDQYQPPSGPWPKVCTTRRCDPVEEDCADFGQPCGPGIARCASWLCLPDPVTGEGFCSAQCEPNQGCPPGADCVLREVPGREDSIWACR